MWKMMVESELHGKMINEATHSVNISWVEFGRLFEEEQARVGVHHVLNIIEIRMNEEGGGDVVKEGDNVVKGGVNGKVDRLDLDQGNHILWDKVGSRAPARVGLSDVQLFR